MSSMIDRINDRERELEKENEELKKQVEQLKDAIRAIWVVGGYGEED